MQCGQTEGQVKVGHTGAGSQRYLCRGCGHKYTPMPKHHGYEDHVRQQALRLYVDGINLRRIERILGVSRQSVANWVNAYAQVVPALPPVPSIAIQVAELDELYTFIGQKKTGSILSPK